MSITEIKKELTDAFMADAKVREKWQIQEGKEFEEVFKTSSIESLLFYIVASVIYIREKAHEIWLKDVEATALSTRYGTKQWWHKMALMWQDGDSAEIMEDGKIGYAEEDEDKKKIKYAAIVPEGRAVYVRVAKTSGEELKALTSEELSRFQDYLDDIKPLGIPVVGQSFEACKLDAAIKVYYDGERDSEEVKTECEKAIKDYIKKEKNFAFHTCVPQKMYFSFFRLDKVSLFFVHFVLRFIHRIHVVLQ